MGLGSLLERADSLASPSSVATSRAALARSRARGARSAPARGATQLGNQRQLLFDPPGEQGPDRRGPPPTRLRVTGEGPPTQPLRHRPASGMASGVDPHRPLDRPGGPPATKRGSRSRTRWGLKARGYGNGYRRLWKARGQLKRLRWPPAMGGLPATCDPTCPRASHRRRAHAGGLIAHAPGCSSGHCNILS